MITIAMATVIGAARERVWDALTSPGEVVRWDDRMLSVVEAPGSGLVEGGVTRWRYRLGSVPIEVREQTLEVAPGLRLHTAISMGLFEFEETCTLSDESRRETRVAIRLTARNALPVVGGMIDRFDVRRMASLRVDARLRGLRDWCEQPPASRARSYV